MSESALVLKIRNWLVQNGCLAFKYHGSIYGYRGHADIYGVLPSGRAFFLEVKVPGQKPKEFQKAFLDLTEKAGALSGWADSLEGVKKLVGPHLKR